MVLNKLTLNFKNARYEKEYQVQTEKYQKKINNVQGIILMIFSAIVNIDVFLYTQEKLIILTGMLPLVIEAIALYHNRKHTQQAKFIMFFAIISHVSLSASLSYYDFRQSFNQDQNFIFGSLNGLIVGIVSTGLQQWFLKEMVTITYVFATFLSVTSGFNLSELMFFIPLIVILILLSNIISYYKEMQVKIQFYDQLVAKDTIFDLKNLLQNNIPQSVFVVSQKAKKQLSKSVNINQKGKGNNSTNQHQENENNQNESQISIECEDDLVINFQNKYFSEYQQRFKFSNDITSFLKQIKIPSGLQASLATQTPNIQKLQDPSNLKNLGASHKGVHQESSILDVIIQQIKITALEKSHQNDSQMRQRRQTIAQDKGFQLDDMKEFFNCQYRQDQILKSQVLNQNNNNNKNNNNNNNNKVDESTKKSNLQKRRKKQSNTNSNMMSEFRNFGRALSQISMKNFAGSNSNTPIGVGGTNEVTFLNPINTINANSSNIYNGVKKKQNTKSQMAQQEGLHLPTLNDQKIHDIRRKSKTVQPFDEGMHPSSNNTLNQFSFTQANNKLSPNKATNPIAYNRKNSQTSQSGLNNSLQNQQQNQVAPNHQPQIQNISFCPNIAIEMQSLSKQDQQTNLPSAMKPQQNKLTRINSAKVDAESIYIKQSRQSMTSQSQQRHLRYSTQPKGDNNNNNNNINNNNNNQIGGNMKRNSYAGALITNSITHQLQSIHNLNNKMTKQSENNLVNRSSPILHFDIQLVKCQWEENDAVMVIMNDISEKVMNLRLKESDKYKDEMLATVTHNLKTPLNSMILMINKLLKKDKKNIELKIISQSSHMLLLMIMDILDYQCIKRKTFKLEIEAFDLIEVLKEVKMLYQLTADLKGLDIHIVNNITNPDMQLVLQDIDRIKQILNNLVGNAIKFTKKGSVTITVSLENSYKNDQSIVLLKNELGPSSIPSPLYNNLQGLVPLPPLLSKNQPSNITTNTNTNTNNEEDVDKSIRLNNYQRIFKNNGVISIQVKDTGSGIDESLQNKLFKIFATHDHNNGSTKHGVGLGLTVCKKIAKLIGPKREITLESAVGKGSAFTFYIYQNLLTSPKKYNSELKNQVSPITISSSHEPLNLHLPTIPLHKNQFSQFSDNEQAQLVPISSVLKNSLLTANGNQNNFNKQLHSPESPAFKTDIIDTGMTPRNQQSLQFKQSECSYNQFIKEENTSQKQKTNTQKGINQNQRKKSSKLFQGNQISLFLDLNSPLPQQKQFQQQYLSTFLNFTPRSQKTQPNQQATVIQNNCNKNQPTKHDSGQFNDLNIVSSHRLIEANNNNNANNNIGINSPTIISSNSLHANKQENDLSDKINLQKIPKNNLNNEGNDIIFKSGEINDIILSESQNKTPEKLNHQYTENSPNGRQSNMKLIIQTPKKSLFKIDSKLLIQHKNYSNSINNIPQFPQSSTSISIDRHLNQYASNNLINANIEYNNKCTFFILFYFPKYISFLFTFLSIFHFFLLAYFIIRYIYLFKIQSNQYNNYLSKDADNYHNDDNLDFDENYKPFKHLESQTMIGLESHRQNLLNQRNSTDKIEMEQFNANLRKYSSLVHNQSVGMQTSDQKVIKNNRQQSTYNIQDCSRELNSGISSSLSDNEEEDEDDDEDYINEDDDQDNDQDNNNSKDEDNLDVDAVEEDDDESKEDEDNINLEGLFSNTINALIVDDTPFNIFVFKSFFQNCKNIKFSQAFDGKEAFELYRENKYDLIFMDLNMPIMDGFESISTIRQYEHQNNLKETIIFAVTAQDQIKDIQKCIDCGANGHIPKPVKINLLYSSLYQYFKRR